MIWICVIWPPEVCSASTLIHLRIKIDGREWLTITPVSSLLTNHYFILGMRDIIAYFIHLNVNATEMNKRWTQASTERKQRGTTLKQKRIGHERRLKLWLQFLWAYRWITCRRQWRRGSVRSFVRFMLTDCWAQINLLLLLFAQNIEGQEPFVCCWDHRRVFFLLELWFRLITGKNGSPITKACLSKLRFKS